MRYVALLLVSACATTGALAIGPTIDSNRVVRLEGEAGAGAVDGNNVTALADPSQRTIGVFSVGVRLALAAGTRLSYSQGWFGGYIEYLQLGTEGARWGFHAGLTIATTLEGRPKMLIGLNAGLDRLAHAHSMDTGDGYATTLITDGLDITIRGLGRNWWQVGASYVRRGTVLYE
ncbi:MAG: hypothetical protein JWO36_3171 [Myxococcales bacterium]|nr:hypothetical protein [Myxococcales bacterium]